MPNPGMDTWNFNPRSHKGSDGGAGKVHKAAGEDFNPRSHKGSDKMGKERWLMPPDFNPRSHKGSDVDDSDYTDRRYISIHAPTRGATGLFILNVIPAIVFQSTLPQGERHNAVGLCIVGQLFQSTLPQGERRRRRPRRQKPLYFNPRSHKGSDSNFTQNSISVLFHFYQSFPHIIFPHTARFRLLIIFCTFFLVRIAQRFPVCFHFAPKQYPAFYNVCSTDLL